MASPSAVFTEMVTTTDRHWGSKVTDNVSEHNALVRRLKDRGKIKTVSGGYEASESLEYAENSTFQRYSGYDALNTGASDVLTAAKYDWCQAALHVTASGREIRMNMGSKERMINLVSARKKNALRTGANKLSLDVYSDGALANQISGLSAMITTDGTGTVGGIVSDNYTFWKNKFKEMTGTNLAAAPSVANSVSMMGDMNKLWLDLVRGADKPDLIPMSHDLYSLYELSQQDKQRYADSEMAKAGFSTLKYKTADVIFDDNANFTTTAERAYFLNTNYIGLTQHAEAQWTMDDEKRPTNQDAVVIPFYWMGYMWLTNRSLQGVMFDAS